MGAQFALGSSLTRRRRSSRAGSDWQGYRVMDLTTRKDLAVCVSLPCSLIVCSTYSGSRVNAAARVDVADAASLELAHDRVPGVVLDRLAQNESLTIPTSFHFLTQNEDRSTRTVLVTEDNPEISYFLAKKLIPSFGYKTLQATTGKEGLEMIRRFRPDVALLDLQLPDMDGLDVLRELAKEGQTVPAILMTAHGSEQVAIDAFRLGVQDYLSKPVDAERLKQLIARILNQRNMQEEKAKLTSRDAGKPQLSLRRGVRDRGCRRQEPRVDLP